MTPIYAPGDRVRVRALDPAGHCRTPGYLRGRRGVVTRCIGVFPDPEKLAYHDIGLPHLPLYTVTFDAAEVWDREDPGVTIAADIYQPWLEHDG